MSEPFDWSSQKSAAKGKRPEVRLSPVKSHGDLEQLVAMAEDEDVWKHLDFDEQPTMQPGLKLSLSFGRWDARFIHAGPDDEKVGLIVTNNQELKTNSVVEMDIAISNLDYRGLGISTPALALAFDEWLVGGKCEVLWTWVDLENEKSLKMLESMDIPIIGELKGQRVTVDGAIDSRELRMNREQWVAIREKLAGYLGLPELP